MTITTQLSNDKSTITISISGRFDFNIYKDFRDAYESAIDSACSKFIINLSQTEYMDSSALGMLLVLRERTGADKSSITLTHCNKEIKNILTISNFEKLFTID